MTVSWPYARPARVRVRCVRVAPSLAHSFIRRCLHCALVMMLLRGTISPDIAMCKNGLGVECNCLYALPFVFASVAFPTGKSQRIFLAQVL